MINIVNKYKLNIKTNKRGAMCKAVKKFLLKLEKYSSGKQKMTYLIVPENHSTYKFPLNLEDRINHYKDSLRQLLGDSVKIRIVKDEEIELSKEVISILKRNKGEIYNYIMKLQDKGSYNIYKNRLMEEYDAKLIDGFWIIHIR